MSRLSLPESLKARVTRLVPTPRSLQDHEAETRIRALLAHEEATPELLELAREITRTVFKGEVHLRGLLEITNHCRRRCRYCGIKADCGPLRRYRLDAETILEHAQIMAQLGYGTMVLQGGEDPGMTLNALTQIIARIKQANQLAITLSLGEMPLEAYRTLRSAGADRFLLRFETSDAFLYRLYHPGTDLHQRLTALKDIRTAGFQVGTGFLMGLPGATLGTLSRDLLLTTTLTPDMIGVGPYIPPDDSAQPNPWRHEPSLFFRVMALLRILNPFAHIPATTAFDALLPGGRKRLLSTCANVMMPSFTPGEFKTDYHLYPKKSVVDDGLWHPGRVTHTIEAMGLAIGSGPGHSLLMHKNQHHQEEIQ